MNTIKNLNTILGWCVFGLALILYSTSMEPTASFWDCGEFIAASYKLQVPHPPGAPLFLLIGRLFSFLSFGNSEKVAYWINFSSVLAGAFTSMFLFWSIVYLAKKFYSQPSRPASDFLVLGAGFVGAVTYTVCDSAWFSAVEAEVYSMSSLFTAMVFWAMLRWETIADEGDANRWLIFIFYLMGLSIGVHLLNLVTIPALALIYYFKKFKPSFAGAVMTLGTGLFVIFMITQVVIPGLPTWAGAWEIFCVNKLSLPFYSGIILFAILGSMLVIGGILISQRRGYTIVNTFLLAFTFVIIGYSSYVMVVIRSGFNPPINENDPSDVISFVRYLNREQYGTRPLAYGPYFYAKLQDWEDGEAVYVKGKEKYEIADHKVEVRYNPKEQTIFPRMWSSDEDHQQSYRQILGLKQNERPTFTDNLRFLFKHQIGWMYVRYFFFNFAGRESDDPASQWFQPAQWFKPVPHSIAANKGRNNYFMIPFMLGLLGMYYQAVRDAKGFSIVGLLFILTGVALVIYLNSPPNEPRARDYIYVGSYYAFAFWIGFSVIALGEAFRKFVSAPFAKWTAFMIGLTAPAIMLMQNWDDHNRSARYFSVDTAINDLQSCAPDSILFTGGDNDTFLQWYTQEVEEIRTDVRVVVASYFNSSWYIEQTMRKINDSESIPYTLTKYHYRIGGPNNPYLPYYDAKLKAVDLKEYVRLLKEEFKGLRVYPTANVVPARDLVLIVDVEKVKLLNIVPSNLSELMVPEMHLVLTGNGLEIKDLAFLDILASNDWIRPVYVTPTALRQFNINLSPYAVREGNVYRILPVLNPNPDAELVNTTDSYNRVVGKFQFRGLDDPDQYFSDDYRRAVQNHRNVLNTLAIALLEEGDIAKSKEIVNLSLMRMPDAGVEYDVTALQTIQLLFSFGDDAKAIQIAETVKQRSFELAEYLLREERYGSDLNLNVAIVGEIGRLYAVNDQKEKAVEVNKLYNQLARMLGASRSEM